MMIKKLKSIINKRFENWLTKRMPAVDNVILHRGNTFIFPSKFGWMFLSTCTVMFFIGTNYQNNLILFLVFFMLSFMITCLLLSYKNLAGLALSTIKSEDQYSSEDSQFTLRIKPVEGTAQQTVYTFKHATSLLKTVVLEDKVQLFAKSEQRGFFNPGRVTIKSDYPFGLFNVWTHLDFGLSCLLYPCPMINKLPHVTFTGEKTENGRQQNKVGFDSFNALKPFKEGDSLKSIAWKQVAQGKGFFTKEFEQEQGGDVYLSFADFQGLSIEHRLSMLTYQVIEHEQQGLRYALDLGAVVIEVGNGEHHQKRCLRALALYGQHNEYDNG